jgi:hypothetical protein
MLTIGMSEVALAIAREAQSRGGALLHGALAEAPIAPSPIPAASQGGRGVLLAGPGTVGKTTASERLPPPWRALCDDATLVVRDAEGRYWAHPWPTWSRFYTLDGVPGPGGSWDVQRAVPLRAVFFLSQSPEDRAEPLGLSQATAMLMESAEQVSRPMARSLREDERQALYREQLAAAEALARAVPTYTLQISLTGAFWQEIERVLHLERTGSTASRRAQRGGAETQRRRGEAVFEGDRSWNAAYGRSHTEQTSLDACLDAGALHVSYSGPSMNPILREPDLLEVAPYEGRPVRRGDVVYFRPPARERGESGRLPVVHRVIQVDAQGGVRTRGDANRSADPYCLRPDAIIGRVVAAQRGGRRRRIAGGRRGLWVGRAGRLWRAVDRAGSRLLNGAYRALAASGLFRRLLPARLRPRVYVFYAPLRPVYKLMMGRTAIGRYDRREELWRIRRPFRLFLGREALPAPPPEHRL